MRKLIASIAVLLALAVLVDFGAAAYSEYRVSRAIRQGAHLDADPQVTAHGFPFVTQAASGKFLNVQIIAEDFPSEVGSTTIEANLRGVRIPLSTLLDGTVRTVPVDQLDGRVSIEAVELGKFFKIPDLQVSAPPASKSDGTGGSGGSGMTTDGGVVLTGTVSLGPLKAKVSVQADLKLDGDRVSIVATDLYLGPAGDEELTIPSALKPVVLGLFTKSIDRQQLPFGIAPTTIYAQGSKIVIEGTAKNVTIDLDQIQAP